MTMQHGNYIGGGWVRPEATIPNVNPSDLQDTIGQFGRGDAGDVDAAVAAARAAFPRWSRMVPYQRGMMLRKVAVELEARREELATLLAREEGKTFAEAVGEVLRAAQIFDFFAGETVRIQGDLLAALRADVTVEITLEPLGVIGAITPWNFPLAIPAWKIAPALAYGNCVVFKPSELVPASACELVRIIERAGVPAGVLNLVLGQGPVVGQRILEHPDVNALSFTGSVATGRRVAAAAVGGETMKKVQLEMGGKNPLVILDDADLDNAVDVAVDGAFYGTGQKCTASSRLIVTEGIHDRFVAEMQKRMAALVVDDALKPHTHIGPVVDEKQLEIDLSYIALGQKEGAHLACGGRRVERQSKGFYLSPALFVDAQPDMRVCRDEIFGPVAAVIRVKDYDEALAVANDTRMGLSSAICTTSLKHAVDFKRNSQAGMVKVNLATTGADFHVPFGGRKDSSYGPHEQGGRAREFFTDTKMAYLLAL